MNGFIRKTVTGLCLAGGAASIGCMGGERYRNTVDPCYPARYNAAARQEVIASFAPQVQNGHILDQTIWNYHFDLGTDKLNAGGLAKLDQLVQRRPEPDTRIFLATARDPGYDAAAPEKYIETQQELNSKRVAAVEKYLRAQTAGRPLNFEILVHDPSDPSIAGTSARQAILSNRFSTVGTLQGAGGGGGGVQVGGGGGGGQVGAGVGGQAGGGGYGGGGQGGSMGGGTPR